MKQETCNIVNFGSLFYPLFQVSCYMFHEKEIAKKFTKIHQERKSSDSPRGFRLERARKTNPTVISKIFKKFVYW